jgi:hypothetical protein
MILLLIISSEELNTVNIIDANKKERHRKEMIGDYLSIKYIPKDKYIDGKSDNEIKF